MHLLHNKPDPLRYLYPRADQLPHLVQHVPLLRQSVEQRFGVHEWQSHSLHLHHNKPDPLRYLYHHEDLLPDLVRSMPAATAPAPAPQTASASFSSARPLSATAAAAVYDLC